MSTISISGLHIYPIKSASGEDRENIGLDCLGLIGDRRWMIIDENHVFLGQRKHPRMALIRAQPEGDGLTISIPGFPNLHVSNGAVCARHRVHVHKESFDGAADLGDAPAALFSQFFGFACRLVYMDEQCRRPIAFVPVQPGECVNFADTLPLLLVSGASLNQLNQRLAEPVDMSRFRPNLVVSGCAPHEEDRWRRIRIGEVVLRGEIPCNRCVITTVDPATGEFSGKEPLATLAGYRRNEHGKVLFGMTFVPEKTGRLRVGDEIEVLETFS